MALDNDTRGWIMASVSGLGMSASLARPFVSDLSSLHLWRKYNMHRHSRSFDTPMAQLQSTGQQRLPRLFSESELWSHGKADSECYIPLRLTRIALLCIVQHATIVKKLINPKRHDTYCSSLYRDPLLSGRSYRHPNPFGRPPSLHPLSRRRLRSRAQRQ